MHRLQNARRDSRETTRLAPSSDYCGRFAPSPTGALHFGSLVAAVASFADARAHAGRWLLRIDDIDHTRCVAEAVDSICETLHAFGFYWDAPIYRQSDQLAAYDAALTILRDHGHSYPCACSRRAIAAVARHGCEGPIYPGTCRQGLAPGAQGRSQRLRTPAEPISFVDAIQGQQTQCIADEIGDFVIRRADGVIAYQLAVVIDDAAQNITHVVRGADLLLSTPRQIYLQRLLGLPTPSYAHIPVVRNEEGNKLSKSTAAPAIDPHNPLPTLQAAWHWLGQPPLSTTPSSVTDFWSQAIPAWSRECV